MEIKKLYKLVCKNVLNKDYIKHDVNSAILALHESATKIWQAKENNDNKKINLRVASALISIFYIMNELKIDDPEKILLEKIEHLKKEL
ncbi:MAG: hypothetical protein WC414_02545 [Patescibacteria group bacterium]